MHKHNPHTESDIATRLIWVTRFKNAKAQTKRCEEFTLPKLRDLIQSTTAKNKFELPWIKLAEFGTKRSKKNCLRYNKNFDKANGVEAEYDKELISFETAHATLKQAGIRALLYTSPSHQLLKPRWRILAPFETPLPPDKRKYMVARLNGLFGGALADESFTLSQSYLYGSINNNPDHQAIVLDGDFIDSREDLDVEALFKNKAKKADDKPRVPNKPTAPTGKCDTALQLLSNTGKWSFTDKDGEVHEKTGWNGWNDIGMAYYRARGNSDEGFENFDAWCAKNPDKYDPEDAYDTWYHRFAGSPPDEIGAGTLFLLVNEEQGSGWQLIWNEENPEELAKWNEEHPDKKVDAGKLDGIIMKGGQLVPIAIAAEAALIKSGASIYQRKDHLVQPVKYGETKTAEELTAEAKDKNAIHRDRNATVLRVIDKPHLLIGQMSTATKWYRKSAKGKLIEDDPAPKYATEILARGGKWKFPVLRGVIAAPTLDRHGNIIEKPGYDKSTGLLLDFKKNAYPPVPQNPTKQDALAALGKLKHPLRGFPFSGEDENTKVSPSRSVALSAILCAPIRPSLSIVPLHGINSPMAGTGKSMLAKIPAIIATGVVPVAINQGHTQEEDEKRLSVVLNEGDPVIMIDNCERPITGAFLCSMLTEEMVQARILGLSERRLLPCISLVIANGNNLIYAGDVVRRSLDCRLNADIEHPEERQFDFSALDEVRQQRAELLVAALTVLRAYTLAKPKIELKPMGDYKDYEWIRGALVWLGESDPIDTQKDLLAFDPMKDGLLKVLTCWDNAFGNRKVQVAELGEENAMRVGVDKKGNEIHVPDDSKAELRTALIEEACRNGVWNSRSIGWWLRKNMDKYAGGLCLKRFGSDTDDRATWKVLGGKGPVKLSSDPVGQRFSEHGNLYGKRKP